MSHRYLVETVETNVYQMTSALIKCSNKLLQMDSMSRPTLNRSCRATICVFA